MFLSRKDHVLPEMVRRRIVVIKNEENKSHNSTVGYRCNTIIEKCKEIAVIQERKKNKKRHAFPAASNSARRHFAREATKTEKWYRSFSSRAGNILVRKFCRNKSVYGRLKVLVHKNR